MNARSIAILLLVGVLSGCSKSSTTPQSNDPNKNDAAIEIDPREYFPMKGCSRWVYDLKLGDADLEQQWDLVWPTRDGRRSNQTHDIKMPRPNATATLTLEIKQAMTPAAMFDAQPYSSGVLVELTTDTLPIYSIMAENQNGVASKQAPQAMIWGIREDTFQVEEILLFDVGNPPKDADRNFPGRQERTVFFNPSELLKVEERNGDVSITSLGMDRDVPGYEGQPCLRLARFYGGLENLRFTEELWYAKDKGLVRKVQRVGDKVTLTQTLRDFIPGQ